ncbi:MAG: lipopolysaccharide kinase InaA family protein [Pseudomonadaceae bacterium]
MQQTQQHSRPADFESWWNQQGEWVEAPNQRRDGNSGVQRLAASDGSLLYLKRQTGHLSRSLRHPFGRPTVVREARALDAYRAAGVKVPGTVFAGARQQQGTWQGLLVTEALRGFVSLDEWYASNAASQYGAAVHRHMLRELAATLGLAHAQGLQHGCLYSKHVFIRLRSQGVEIALLDLEKSRRRWRKSAAVRHDLTQLYRHRGAMPESDWFQMLEDYRKVAVIAPSERLLGRKTPIRPKQA